MNKLFVCINAKNIHKAIAPWAIKAYCEKQGAIGFSVLEANVNDSVYEIVSRILIKEPDVIIFSCYIWNIELVKKIGGLIRELLPKAVIVLGGPEVSFEEDLSDFDFRFANYLLRGAGEVAVCRLLKKLSKEKCETSETKEAVVQGCSGDFNDFPSFLTEDYFQSFSENQIPFIEKQLIYYESSRGCPFSCSYCISSTDEGVFYLEIERVKNELKLLVDRGATVIKFVDRTFNANKERAKKILEFILKLDTTAVFHFECAGDLFDEVLLEIIEKMPKGRVQFEIGIQTVNEKTIKAIGRKVNNALALKNIKKITSFDNVHVHVDLIAGLPYETLKSFIDAINCCLNAKPHHLQLGFLKMLKGTRIRNQNDFGAVFTQFPPYEVYKTNTLSHRILHHLKKMESLIEKFYNSGIFLNSLNYGFELFGTPYDFFDNFIKHMNNSTINFKSSIKNAYSILFEFLSRYGEKLKAEHFVKLDCLLFDSKGLLPDKIMSKRDKQKELDYRRNNKTKNRIRIEYFDYDSKYRLFNYDSVPYKITII